MNIQKKFGATVRGIREQQGWSQDHLAEKSELHRTYISGIERGARNPTLSVIEKLAQALNVTPDVLLAFPTKQEELK